MDDPVRNPYVSPHSLDQSEVGNDDAALAAHARTGQIITFALVQGVIVIGAVMAFLSWQGPANQAPAGAPAVGDDLILLAVGIIMAVGSWIAAIIVPGVIRRNAADQLSESADKAVGRMSIDALPPYSLQKFLGASQSATLVGQAVLEGAAVANLILMFVDGNWIHLLLAVVCVIGIAFQVPTTEKLRTAIESSLRL